MALGLHTHHIRSAILAFRARFRLGVNILRLSLLLYLAVSMESSE
jgi:hypothetical protein